MRLPTIIPNHLQYLAEVKSDEELLDTLLKNQADLIDFFEYAADDETWSEEHGSFQKRLIKWFTEQHLQDRLIHEWAERVVKKLQQHIEKLTPFIPLNISFIVEEKQIKGNSMLFGIMSPYFQDVIRRECRVKGSNTLSIPDVPLYIFQQAEEYIKLGEPKSLWRREEEELLAILRVALTWELEELASECEKILERYIDQDNCLETALLAHREGWLHLRWSAMEFINKRQLGIEFGKERGERFRFIFHDFKERALDLFRQVKDEITHIGYTLNLTEDTQFSETVNSCPQLVGLDISRTRIFNEHLYNIPPSIRELNLSKNPWLDDRNLAEMVKICPNVTHLDISSSGLLGYTGWAELNKLKQLESLNLSRCYQIGDRDLKLILRACRELTELSLEECTAISERLFFDLSSQIPSVHTLNIARTKIDDLALIELLTKSPKLHTLDLTHCEQITNKGVVEAVKHTAILHTLNVSFCHLPEDTLEELKRLKPFMTLIS